MHSHHPAASADPVPMRPKFISRQFCMTPGAQAALVRSRQMPSFFFDRHFAGDWGDLCPEDIQANDDALKYGNRILSAYHTLLGDKIWIITEANRSVTTILLPKEY